jgi:pantoate--beta-alanine ligase
MPDVETLYPFGIDNATLVSVPALSDELFGLFRPGHFNGVSSVITRLFNLVQPDVAVFGQKDYQQQLVINRLVKDLNLPIKVICGETVREDDGLALSSKNRYLSEEERALAPKIHETLDEIGHELENGQRNFEDLETQAFEKLKSLGFMPEYVSIRRAENLDALNRDCDELVVLVSAWLGKAHLIDNLVVHI